MGWQTFLIRKYAESRPQSFKKDSLHKRRKKAERGQKKLGTMARGTEEERMWITAEDLAHQRKKSNICKGAGQGAALVVLCCATLLWRAVLSILLLPWTDSCCCCCLRHCCLLEEPGSHELCVFRCLCHPDCRHCGRRHHSRQRC